LIGGVCEYQVSCASPSPNQHRWSRTKQREKLTVIQQSQAVAVGIGLDDSHRWVRRHQHIPW